jgi:hypothetical protein
VAVEASGRNRFNILPNNYVLLSPKIPNQASFVQIDQKITGNSQESIPGIDSNIPDSGMAEAPTRNLPKTRRDRK